jgi:hypothetical protein
MNNDNKILNLASLAELSAGTIRVFVLDDSKSNINCAKPWVQMRCKEAAKLLDFCAGRIDALERFVQQLTKVKTITDTPEFGEILDELMTSMEDDSEEYCTDDEDEKK